jgi:hypothetical protein
MQRASESIGALAAALAKAQSELSNPEKSLTATIASQFPREGSRTFRYAPLASGLDLVRKCLGRHEIATVQTTAMDKESGLICLTTTLVHSSGEWVSSDWPVCPTSETAAPHRLGAALTYARRYALFTLVGIAGEDDLDAPDQVLPKPSGFQNVPAPVSRFQASSGASGPLHAPRSAKRPELPRLTPKASHELADRLLSEVAGIQAQEVLAAWTRTALPLKNRLQAEDAERVESAFSDALSRLGEAPSDHSSPDPSDPHGSGRSPEAHHVETVVTIAKPVRERDRQHLRFVAAQPCLVCGRAPSDAHHIKFAELKAMGRKVSDRFTVPLCRLHHRELHRRGNERLWWQTKSIDALPVAATLWGQTHAGGLIESDIATNVDEPRINGVLTGALAAAIHDQNDETKPIPPPEA